jgi:hypothetical protein
VQSKTDFIREGLRAYEELVAFKALDKKIKKKGWELVSPFWEIFGFKTLVGDSRQTVLDNFMEVE